MERYETKSNLDQIEPDTVYPPGACRGPYHSGGLPCPASLPGRSRPVILVPRMAEDDLIDYSDLSGDEVAGDLTAYIPANAIIASQSSFQSLVEWRPALRSRFADCGMEFPSRLQQLAIPLLVERTNAVCLAKAGMGKTTSYITAALQQLQPLGR